jgi:hypothetical protein
MGRTQKRRSRRNDVNYTYIKSYLKTIKNQSGCIRCGEHDPNCLDYHHLDPTQKLFHLGDVRGRSLREIDTEVLKCVVICANCHRKLHAGLFTL